MTSERNIEDVGNAAKVKEIIINDRLWDKVDYVLNFRKPIYDKLRFVTLTSPCFT